MTLLASVLTDLVRLGARVLELGLVLLQGGLRLRLGLLGLLHAALDGGRTLLVELLHLRDDLGLVDPVEDPEGHEPDDDLRGVRQERQGLGPPGPGLTGGCDGCEEHVASLSVA